MRIVFMQLAAQKEKFTPLQRLALFPQLKQFQYIRRADREAGSHVSAMENIKRAWGQKNHNKFLREASEYRNNEDEVFYVCANDDNLDVLCKHSNNSMFYVDCTHSIHKSADTQVLSISVKVGIESRPCVYALISRYIQCSCSDVNA